MKSSPASNNVLRNFRDPVSGLTHLAGALLGVIGLFVLVGRSLDRGTIEHTVSFAVFGVTLILLYVSSANYHLRNVSDAKRKFFRQLDHSMIFIFIAGSYTPYCVLSLHGSLGLWSLVAVWAIAVAGTVLKIFWIGAPRWLSVSLYLAMGWLSMVVIVPLSRTVPSEALTWLIVGGLCYTFGAIIYGIKKPDPYPGVFGFHEVWHLFVMAGSFSHFLSISTLLP